MGRLFAVEVVYRGIFQKTLARNITRAIVLAAHHEGKPGISFGRYGDSPERNGIPAKAFAIVATDDITLEEGMAKYEPKEVDISIAVDDTLCKGVESWAWYGLQPINRLTKPNGTLIVTSREEPARLIEMAHRKDAPYNLAILKGTPSFSGLWVYKDDHTDVRVLGAIAKLLPELFSLESVQKAIMQEWNDPIKATSAARSYERDLCSREARPGKSRSALRIRSSQVDRNARRYHDSRHSPGPPDEGYAEHENRRLPTRAQSDLQKVHHTHDAAGGQLRHLHQVYALLAPVPRLLLRRHPGRPLRRQHGGLLRVRRLRSRLPR